VRNLQPVHGTAPAVFAGLPAPDAAFVAGIGREVNRLLEATFRCLRPGGRLVVNVATLESLAATHAALKDLAGSETSPQRQQGNVSVLLVGIARGTEQLESLRFEAVNPTFLLSVRKGERQPQVGERGGGGRADV
jgi:precorrin-6Y C5,15-methyltransferase (decarboxylating)